MDSANKRLSIISAGRPFAPTWPIPDASLANVQDRKHLAYLYRGDEDAAPPAGGAVVRREVQPWVWRDRRRHGAPGHHTMPLDWRWR